MSRRMMIAGNWKMNGLRSDLDFFDALAPLTASASAEIVVCLPATLIALAIQRCGNGVGIGGQDCHTGQSGAHTGDISAAMLRDAGAGHVIVGHSERRRDHGESSVTVSAKAEAALAAGLVPIICVGETLEEREAGQAREVVGAQLRASLPQQANAGLVVAYEPVWAIGTGRVAAITDIAQMHEFIRSQLPQPRDTRILYGGSVKPGNAVDILSLSDVDGALVGGASLEVAQFSGIIEASVQQSPVR